MSLNWPRAQYEEHKPQLCDYNCLCKCERCMNAWSICICPTCKECDEDT